MNCDFGIHEGIRDMGEIICPFCDDQINEIVKRIIFVVMNRVLSMIMVK